MHVFDVIGKGTGRRNAMLSDTSTVAIFRRALSGREARAISKVAPALCCCSPGSMSGSSDPLVLVLVSVELRTTSL
jgi:hypothetical protein